MWPCEISLTWAVRPPSFMPYRLPQALRCQQELCEEEKGEFSAALIPLLFPETGICMLGDDAAGLGVSRAVCAWETPPQDPWGLVGHLISCCWGAQGISRQFLVSLCLPPELILAVIFPRFPGWASGSNSVSGSGVLGTRW